MPLSVCQKGFERDQVKISLPDGSERSLQEGATIFDLAASIGAGLAKAAIAGKIDGNLVDLDTKLAEGKGLFVEVRTR